LTDVEQVLRIAFPSGAAEGEEARLDAWARLAKLHLGPSEPDEARALADLDQGRKEATRDSFYRAHLETVAGEILEARAKRLTDRLTAIGVTTPQPDPAAPPPASAAASATMPDEESSSSRADPKAAAAPAPPRADRSRGKRSHRCQDVSVAADEICSASSRI